MTISADSLRATWWLRVLEVSAYGGFSVGPEIFKTEQMDSQTEQIKLTSDRANGGLRTGLDWKRSDKDVTSRQTDAVWQAEAGVWHHTPAYITQRHVPTDASFDGQEAVNASERREGWREQEVGVKVVFLFKRVCGHQEFRYEGKGLNRMKVTKKDKDW